MVKRKKREDEDIEDTEAKDNLGLCPKLKKVKFIYFRECNSRLELKQTEERERESDCVYRFSRRN